MKTPADTDAIRKHFSELLGKAYIVDVVFSLCDEVDALRKQLAEKQKAPVEGAFEAETARVSPDG